MSNDEKREFFNLYTNGIGYIGRVRDVTPQEGEPFCVVTIGALRGSVDNAQYTYFECRVSGHKAGEIVRLLRPAVDSKRKVLVGFTLSDLYARAFTFKNGDKAGEPGVNLKARLIRINWAKVDGEYVHRAQAA